MSFFVFDVRDLGPPVASRRIMRFRKMCDAFPTFAWRAVPDGSRETVIGTLLAKSPPVVLCCDVQGGT